MISKVAGVIVTGLMAGVTLAGPQVSNVSFSQQFDSRRTVNVTYDLAGSPAIVTASVLTNGVAMDRVDLAGALAGDVNRVVATGSRSFVWRSRAQLPVGLTQVQVKLTAWATNAPPDYLVVDLATGGRFYYESLDELSPAFGDRLYKTKRLLLRKIPAAGVEWTMGLPKNMFNYSDAYAPHQVVLSRDYYIGVYPVTQGQWETLMTGRCVSSAGFQNTVRPSWYTNEQHYAVRPVENVSLRAIYSENVDMQAYPEGPRGFSHKGRFLSELRDLTELPFDLPTEAQWEFACRAGTTSGWYNGYDYAREREAEGLNTDLRTRWNLTQPNVSSADPALNQRNFTPAEGGTNEVGLDVPNAWGLYDLYGNVAEYVADWYFDYATPTRNYYAHCARQGVVVDPKGWNNATWPEGQKVVATAPIIRGGNFYNNSYQTIHSAYRGAGGDMYTGFNPGWGFRVIVGL